jgi:prepilin-type N-terminal cleavage/methylation domain-containing protein
MLMTARRLRSDQSGFSLIELLMAMALGSIVLTALMTIFMSGISSTVKVSDRVEALQRGRITMDRITTLLNSQTCLLNTDGTGQAPILDGQDSQVAFYASLGVVDSDPTIYRLRYDAAAKSLYEDRYAPVRNASNVVTYPSYPASPGVSRLIGTNVLPTTAGAPIFRYWQFVTIDGPTLGMVNTTPLVTPLTATSQLNAVRVTISFVTQPEHTSSSTTDLRAMSIDGVATVGSANAGEPTKGVNC